MLISFSFSCFRGNNHLDSLQPLNPLRSTWLNRYYWARKMSRRSFRWQRLLHERRSYALGEEVAGGGGGGSKVGLRYTREDLTDNFPALFSQQTHGQTYIWCSPVPPAHVRRAVGTWNPKDLSFLLLLRFILSPYFVMVTFTFGRTALPCLQAKRRRRRTEI